MPDLNDRHGRADDSSRSMAELVHQLSEQTSTLIRQELRLATAELKEKGRHAGFGVGMFGGAGLVALYGVGALVAAAIIGLGTLVEPWLAAVIAGVALLTLAGIAAVLGKRQVEQATPPTPEQAVESVQRDIKTVKERVQR
jgi:membrane protein